MFRTRGFTIIRHSNLDAGNVHYYLPVKDLSASVDRFGFPMPR